APEGCLVVASTSSAPLDVRLGEREVRGPGPILVCTCEPTRLAVSGEVGEGGGIAVLRADAAVIGGSAAFTFAPFEPKTTAETDQACAVRSLDAWIAAGRAPKPPKTAAWLEAAPARGALAAIGFVA